MGDTWFLSVPTEQSIRRDDVCLKGIINMAHSIFTKGELSSMLYPLPCATYLVIHSVVNNDQHIYVIGYKTFSKKLICFIAPERGITTISRPYENTWVDCHVNVHSHLLYCPYIIYNYFDFFGIIDRHNQQQQF